MSNVPSLRDEHLDQRHIEGHNIIGRSPLSGAGICRGVVGGRSGCPPFPETPLEKDQGPFRVAHRLLDEGSREADFQIDLSLEGGVAEGRVFGRRPLSPRRARSWAPWEHPSPRFSRETIAVHTWP